MRDNNNADIRRLERRIVDLEARVSELESPTLKYSYQDAALIVAQHRMSTPDGCICVTCQSHLKSSTGET